MLLTKINTDPNLIYEFENIFPAWAITSGDHYFKKFSFEYGHHAASLNDGHPYFGKMLFLREHNINQSVPTIVQNIVDCLQLDILPKIDNKGKFKELQRIAVNGQTETQTPAAHVDTDRDRTLWTAVYYVNDSSGDTVFFRSINDLREIYRSKYRQGKVVVFPSCFCHQAMSPDFGFRITVGITFEWHTELSKKLKT